MEFMCTELWGQMKYQRHTHKPHNEDICRNKFLFTDSFADSVARVSLVIATFASFITTTFASVTSVAATATALKEVVVLLQITSSVISALSSFITTLGSTITLTFFVTDFVTEGCGWDRCRWLNRDGGNRCRWSNRGRCSWDRCRWDRCRWTDGSRGGWWNRSKTAVFADRITINTVVTRTAHTYNCAVAEGTGITTSGWWCGCGCRWWCGWWWTAVGASGRVAIR
mmetsp:Transcript_18842/g.20776  ORF Transcript_18842/g.20776 Transcript_18842/m.20776 type:complete len:226 (+) Transcript_18842:403-1080(+)